jgi:putative hydrolase of the HAD superfamily
MVKDAFSHVSVWVFDLDNTLYPPSARLFDQIEVLMTDYVMQALGVERTRANHLRNHYWQTYGTTLAGLMREHDIDPGPYLDDVHDISLEHLDKDPVLRARIAGLPGRKVIYTNGPRVHAERVTQARGLSGIFDAIYGVEHADFRPKPERQAFEQVFALDGISPEVAAMFEDEPRNLLAPHEMGMKTVLVGPERRAEAAHIHHQTEDLSGFLGLL